MLSWWSRSRSTARTAERLHEHAVDAARDPQLFESIGVPDTLDGRLEMLMLHLAIMIERTQRSGPDGAPLARALSEAYITAMDDTMRAVGVGDLAVPRKVKKAAAALYDRSRAYAPAIHDTDPLAAWRKAFSEVIEPSVLQTIDTERLAAHAVRYVERLSAVGDADLLAGHL